MRSKYTATIEESDLAAARTLLRNMTPELREVAEDWYPLCHDRAVLWASLTGYSTAQVAAVIAVTSINQTWAGNLTLARRALFDGRIVGTKLVVHHVTAILAGEPIADHLTGGSKVQNFYRSIVLEDGCTVDRWMCRVFGCKQNERTYPAVETAVRTLAAEAGVPAYQMQSVLWMAVIAASGKKMRYYQPQGREVSA